MFHINAIDAKKKFIPAHCTGVYFLFVPGEGTYQTSINCYEINQEKKLTHWKERNYELRTGKQEDVC